MNTITNLKINVVHHNAFPSSSSKDDHFSGSPEHVWNKIVATSIQKLDEEKSWPLLLNDAIDAGLDEYSILADTTTAAFSVAETGDVEMCKKYVLGLINHHNIVAWFVNNNEGMERFNASTDENAYVDIFHLTLPEEKITPEYDRLFY